MQYSAKAEKITTRKTLAWYEEGQGRKGDKRNKTPRDNTHKRAEAYA